MQTCKHAEHLDTEELPTWYENTSKLQRNKTNKISIFQISQGSLDWKKQQFEDVFPTTLKVDSVQLPWLYHGPLTPATRLAIF